VSADAPSTKDKATAHATASANVAASIECQRRREAAPMAYRTADMARTTTGRSRQVTPRR
jgi:hypothetical protein